MWSLCRVGVGVVPSVCRFVILVCGTSGSFWVGAGCGLHHVSVGLSWGPFGGLVLRFWLFCVSSLSVCPFFSDFSDGFDFCGVIPMYPSAFREERPADSSDFPPKKPLEREHISTSPMQHRCKHIRAMRANWGESESGQEIELPCKGREF